MAKMIEPDYVHYTRIKTINAKEAQMLLTVFALRDKDFQDKEEYEQAYEEQMKFECTVLWDAIFYKEIKYPERDIEICEFDENGNLVGYHFAKISINIRDFCSWAIGQQYNVPEVMAKLTNNPDCDYVQNASESQVIGTTQEPVVAMESKMVSKTNETQKIKVNKAFENNETNQTNAQLTSQKKAKKSGPRKCTLSLAVELVYLKLHKLGETKVLRPRMRDAFLECFREMATAGNRNSDEGVMVLIKEVSKSRSGKYTIITHDRPNPSNHLKIDEISDEYDASRITRFLNSLRTRYPLPE